MDQFRRLSPGLTKLTALCAAHGLQRLVYRSLPLAIGSAGSSNLIAPVSLVVPRMRNDPGLSARREVSATSGVVPLWKKIGVALAT